MTKENTTWEFDSDDDLDDILGIEDDDTDDTDTKEELTKLQVSLAELEKANKGLLKEVKRERSGRQDFQGRFNELSQTVSEILETKKGATGNSDSTDSNKSSESDKIMIEFDADGNPYIPTGALKGSNAEILEQINTLAEAFNGKLESTKAETAANRVIQSIVSKDENYPGAYARLEQARNFLDKQIIEYQKANNLSGSVTPAQAIQYKDQLFDLDAYGEKFADVDLVMALRAMDTEYDLEQALNHVVQKVTDASTNKTGDADSRFKKVLAKPSGLGKSANAKGAELDATEKLANISSMDLIDNLTDADVEKITQALLREEKQSGVKF